MTEINETEVDRNDLYTDAAELIMLPSNLPDEPEDYHYSSTAVSFYKYAKTKAPIEFLTEPATLIEQRSGDWYAPMILITQAAIAAHPLIVNVLSGLLANYLFDFFKGQTQPQANLDFVIETKKGKKSKFVRLRARCPAKELDAVMKRVKEIANDE